MKYDLVYINLPDAVQRREFVEANFDACGFSSDWTIRRFEATPVDDEFMEQTGSRIRKGQTGCFLSHMECLRQSLDDDSHLVIAEDDVIFSSATERLIRRAVETLSGLEWNMLFTDVCIPNAHDMIRLFPARANLIKNDRLELRSLREIGFAGSTCYIINKYAKRRLYETLLKHRPFTMPYDLYLRSQIVANEIKAYVMFPFATSLSEYANVSQIQTSSEVMTNMLWNSFRQLVWVDGDPDRVLASFENINPDLFDRRALAFAKIMQGMVAESYTPL